jgi:hypothetical protein
LLGGARRAIVVHRPRRNGISAITSLLPGTPLRASCGCWAIR